MHRSYHRIPACGSEHSGQHPRPHHRYARICHRPCHSVHSLRHVPKSAEIGTEIGRMDECGEGGIGIHRTRLRPEVSVGGRPCLRMAYPRPRDIPRPVDSDLRSARSISLGMAQIPARRRGQSHQCAAVLPRNDFVGFRHIHDTRTLGRSAQGYQCVRSAYEHSGLQSLQGIGGG